MVATMNFRFEVEKMVRILLVALVLAVGSLQVTRCSESDDDDIASALQDQADRMGR